MRKGAVSVYLIIGIVIVSVAMIFIFFRESFTGDELYPGIEEVLEYYSACLNSETRNAIDIAGLQGGRIDSGEYIPGSDYAPFSSNLNFLGAPIPYWFYVSGNGLIRDNAPSIEDIQNEMQEFISEGAMRCDFSRFFEQGYSVSLEPGDLNVEIFEDRVQVSDRSNLIVEKDAQIYRKTEHNVEVRSKFGKFYSEAIRFYARQKEDYILEQYAVDTLYNYAPVDGVELQCGPKVWSTQNVENELKQGLENNIASLKLNGNYYTLKDSERDSYFVIDEYTDESVNFVYSSTWPTKIEIYGDGVDDEIMTAEVIGQEAGLGVLGFCYVPYHFVYDVSFPVMVQFYDGIEMFQFPVVVIVDKNVPRIADYSVNFQGEIPDLDLCEFKNERVRISILDYEFNPVDANLSYECFQQRCRLGQTEEGVFDGYAPSCLNGYIFARAGGYADKKEQFSSNKDSDIEIFMDREYNVEVSIDDYADYNGEKVLINFVRDDGEATSAVIPEYKDIKLKDGSYEIRAYVYGNTSLKIPASTRYECVDVPKEGLLGFFGSKSEECFDITIPETKIESAIVGGGSLNTYLLEEELRKGKMKIGVSKFPQPRSMDELQTNFDSLDTSRLEVEFYE